ncbi:hypothetical protein [Protaetiibacter larvae]|uniref:Asparagine synthase n=1 Tax=Protaetiibacter larvae TaxID=2592654 RepID=A0A5C1Y897_9MICO|nr:hypothetical protein [Protaetiibacter larvae]QEO09167.1 hypothetical protein FLP23_03520 [Protaetiibacter larvae]
MPRHRPRRRVRFGELVDDAMLVARSAVRQQLKNLVIVRTLRDGADFELAWYADAARDEFASLADELEADAARITRTLTQITYKHGRAEHVADFQSHDARPLKRRRKVLLAQAARLRALAQDDAAVEGIIAEARTLALDDIAAAAAAVPGIAQPAPLSPSERRIALGDLVDDLLALQAERDATSD